MTPVRVTSYARTSLVYASFGLTDYFRITVRDKTLFKCDEMVVFSTKIAVEDSLLDLLNNDI
jgi:hypothetical protein